MKAKKKPKPTYRSALRGGAKPLYDTDAIYSNPHLLANDAAARWTVANLGGDERTEHISQLIEGQTADAVNEEFCAWLRVARGAVAEAEKRGRCLTLSALEPLSLEPKIAKLYSSAPKRRSR